MLLNRIKIVEEKEEREGTLKSWGIFNQQKIA